METRDYKIKTNFADKPNGSPSGNWVCGIDIGYSAVKVVSPNKNAIFPAFAEMDNSKTIGTPAPYSIIYKNLETGERWIVGESALNNIKQGDTSHSDNTLYGRERYDDPMFLVLVDVAIGIACSQNQYGNYIGKKIWIETGLPSAYLEQDSPFLKNAFAGRHHFALKIGADEPVEYDIVIGKENVDVMEQPMGTLMSIAMGNNHKAIPESGFYFNRNLIIFDGGHGTLDMFIIKNNRVVDKQTFPEFAMKQVLANVRAEIQRNHGVEVSPIAIQKCLETGTVIKHSRFSSGHIPIKEILQRESEKVCHAALDRIGRMYELYEFNYFVITGGTSAAWADTIRQTLSGIEGLVVIDGNQNDKSLSFDYSNARGYYMYLYEKVSRSLRQQAQ